MPKLQIFVIIVALTIATSAQAAYTLAGNEYPQGVSAEISYQLSGGNLILEVANTSDIDSALTSLAFSIPTGVELTFNGAFLSSGDPFVYVQNKNKTYEWSFGEIGGNDVSNRDYVQPYKPYLNVGLFTKKDFLGGRSALGIASGDTAYFEFAISGALDGFEPFLARFQSVGFDGEGSDIATPTPIPGAAWLLGAGLVGLVGLRRFNS